MADQPTHPKVDVENAKQRIRDIAAEGWLPELKGLRLREIIILAFALGMVGGFFPKSRNKFVRTMMRGLVAGSLKMS